MAAVSIFIFGLYLALFNQNAPSVVPKFEDYPNTEQWSGPNADAKIVSRAERMFRTRLREAARQAPNFAGHYRFTTWGCGSNCVQGAMVDLKTGDVIQPPLATKGVFEHWAVCVSGVFDEPIDIRKDSDLLILRCGLNWDSERDVNRPDEYYFVWKDRRWKEVLRVQPPKSR